MTSPARPWRTGQCATAILGACLLAGGCTPQQQAQLRQAQAARADDEQWMAGSDKPATPKTLHSAARVLAAQGRDAEAEAVLRKIVAQEPRYLPAYVDLAEIDVRRRQFDRATATLTAGLKIAPGDPVLLNDLGMCWVLQGDHARALEMFTKAASASPNDSRYLGNMAMALGMLGRYGEALALYEQILPRPDAHDNLAILCQARKDLDRAARERARAAELRAVPEQK